MFSKTCKNSIKTLIRSPIFLLCFFLALVNTVFCVSRPLYGENVIDELLLDTDPRYVLSFDKFMQMIPNHLSHSVMFYAVPVFAVITAMIVMVNDYGKGFFEVEKSGGLKPTTHLLGRFVALTGVNCFIALVLSFFSVNYYYITRGGVVGHGFWECFGFSSVRILRTFLYCEFPAILLFLSLALMCGAVLKNGYVASVIGIGFAIFNYVVSAYFGFRMTDLFNKYLTTNKFSAYLYFTYYDTEVAKKEVIGMGIGHIPSPPSEVFAWVGILFGISFVFIGLALIYTKRRRI